MAKEPEKPERPKRVEELRPEKPDGLESKQEMKQEPKTCVCRHKSTPRSEALQSDVQKRLNRAIGQLNGVKAMIEDNRYCGDVLIQLSAAESAIHRVSEMLLHEHLETCVIEEIRAGNDEVVEEVMDLIRRFS